MRLSVYLHSYIVDKLRMYGKLDDVVNAILDEADNGMFDILDKPNCESREGASRYNIEVTNETYLSLAETFPLGSSRISLRRLIYWFVENEMYDECGWTTDNILSRKNKTKVLKKILDLKENSKKLYHHLSDNYNALMILTEIQHKIQTLEKLYKE
jgi:hypothetical protein